MTFSASIQDDLAESWRRVAMARGCERESETLSCTIQCHSVAGGASGTKVSVVFIVNQIRDNLLSMDKMHTVSVY